MSTGRKLALPLNVDFVGTFQGLTLHYAYSPSARYSDRAMVYVFACLDESEGADFAQVSALRRTSEVDWDESEVQMTLAQDAVRRAKIRIHHNAFETGHVYALELNDLGVNCSFELAE